MIYEIRSYELAIGKVPSYLKLFETTGYAILSRYARPIGFWFTETGLLNSVHHIWAYDNRAHRAERRAALMQDPAWTQTFLPYALPHLVQQTNTLLTLSSGTPSTHPRNGATDGPWLYELTQYADPERDTPNPTDPATIAVFQAASGDLTQRLWLRSYRDETTRSAEITFPKARQIATQTLHPAIFSALR